MLLKWSNETWLNHYLQPWCGKGSFREQVHVNWYNKLKDILDHAPQKLRFRWIYQFRLTFEGYKISIPFPSLQKHLRPHRPQVQMAGYSGEIVLENSRKALENLLLQWWNLMRFWLVLPGTLADISMHSTQARKQPIVFKCLHRKSVTRHDGTGIRSFMKFIV